MADDKEYTIEELKAQAGTERVSSWMVIDQERINQFADVSEHHQFIHLD